MTLGKSGTSFQDKLAKQNEINRQMLVRELSKIEGKEKSDIRMLKTARQRFRFRYKKFGVRSIVSGSEACGVEMYETHNPGFCYHCTGKIRESAAGSLKKTREDPEASYEVVRKMLFTDGEVDVDKIICLHLLTAHVAGNVEPQVPGLDSKFSNLDGSLGNSDRLTGAWNKQLPCYIVDIQRDCDNENLDDFTDHSKLNQDSRHENETVRDFEKSYERYTRNNADIVSALTANDRLARIAPKTLGKMPIISPHVYSLLSASHELRVKQTIAEGYAAKRYYNKRSNVDLEMLDGKSIAADSFRLLDDEEDDGRSASRMTPNTSARDWTSSRAGFSKIPGIKSNSRGSTFGSSNYKIDPSITMLKGKSKGPVEELIKTWRTNENDTINDLVMIKPSYKILAAAASKTSSIKSPFRVMHHGPAANSINSIDSILTTPRYPTKKYKKVVYLNSPIKHIAFRTQEYKTVKIFVNNQIQALVHSVLQVLENVNPDKLRRIVETAKDLEKIREIFGRPDIRIFLHSLMDQPLVLSPESFVVSTASVVEEIDMRLERFLEDELVATTLELPTAPILEMLMREIRDNISLKEKSSHAIVTNSTDESKAEEMSVISKSEESKSSKLVIENQKEKSSDNDEATLDHEEPIKSENNNFANNPKRISNEGIQVLNEINKLEEKTNIEIPGKNRNKIMKDSMNKKASNSEDKVTLKIANSLPYERNQFKPQKATQEAGYLDPDRVILRRMTNEQRILVGRMCAALKNRRINNEGLIRERTPLAALITPVLSRESIKMLTRGTTYANKSVGMNKIVEEKEEQTVARTDRLTGPVLAKVRRDVAEHETKRRLDDFFTK